MDSSPDDGSPGKLIPDALGELLGHREKAGHKADANKVGFLLTHHVEGELELVVRGHLEAVVDPVSKEHNVGFKSLALQGSRHVANPGVLHRVDGHQHYGERLAVFVEQALCRGVLVFVGDHAFCVRSRTPAVAFLLKSVMFRIWKRFRITKLGRQ